MARILPLGTLVGGLILTLAWVVLGAISPGYQLFDLVIKPYSPISQPISGLGLGVTGPWMNAAFILGGLAIFVGVIALLPLWPTHRLRRTSVTLLSLIGVGMVIVGLFTLESVMAHLLGFLLGVPLPAIGFIIAGVSLRQHWRTASTLLLISSPLTLALFAWFMVTFDPYSAGDNVGVAGLVQRILITVVFATVAVTGLTAWKSTRSAAVTPGRSNAHSATD